MKLRVLNLERVEYGRALEIQTELNKRRREGAIEDTLMLVEHDPVLTIGRSGNMSNLVESEERLKDMGIAVVKTGRGGDITYHGPGQLVGYPIVNIKDKKLGVKDYVNRIEEVAIRLLNEEFGLDAYRDEINNGVWVNEKKIMAVGFTVKRWVTMHGFALNINTDLEHFKYIVPCGIVGREASSISKELGYKIDFEEVSKKTTHYFKEVFNYKDCEYIGGLEDDK